MDPSTLVEELTRVAARLGVEVRVEPFETPPAGGGGRCLVAGRPLILLDAGAAPARRAEALARALAGHDVDAVYMAPEARDLVEAARATGGDPTPGRRPPPDTA